MVYIPGSYEPRRESMGAPPAPVDRPESASPPAYAGWTPPPLKKRRTGLIVGLIFAALVLGTGSFSFFVANGVFNRKPAGSSQPVPSWTPLNWSPAAAPVKTAPDPKGFTIGITILRKACFGSAGCNVTFRIDPKYSGTEFTRTTTWRVVYQVSGTTDAYTNSFTLTGSEASMQSEEMVETPSSSAALSATAVSVVEA